MAARTHLSIQENRNAIPVRKIIPTIVERPLATTQALPPPFSKGVGKVGQGDPSRLKIRRRVKRGLIATTTSQNKVASERDVGLIPIYVIPKASPFGLKVKGGGVGRHYLRRKGRVN